MYPSSTPVPALPTRPTCAPAAAVNYAFLANPPKQKHRPQPITVRCAPARSLPRPTSSRRRASISGSPPVQASFLALVDTPAPTSDTPKTPGLTNHGYIAAFATYPRRGSVPDTHNNQTRPARRSPVSPKRPLPPRSAPSSPKRPSGSPKRRQHRVPSPTSPFAPPSPTRTRAIRARAESTARIPVPTPRALPPPQSHKLLKIRSLTNLRSRSPSPMPPSGASSSKPPVVATPTSTPKSTNNKKAKRSATPARGSAAYAKYRPMPFIQQMQMIQFLEGGSLESHIRRHHVHAGQGTAHTGFATGGDLDVAHGYAFTDEQGMIWFDEEEEWEFACLLPRARPQQQRRRGIKRLLGRRREEESDAEWEEFVAEEEDDEDVDPAVLLARQDDDLRAGQDDLAAFGGALEGAWARDRPGRSVLNLPESKQERKHKRACWDASSAATALGAQPVRAQDVRARDVHARTTALKNEFLATAFAPPPSRTASPSPPLARAISPFRLFTRAATPTEDSATTRTLFQRHHRQARSVPKATAAAGAGAGAGQSFASLGASLRGGSVLDAPNSPESPQSPTVQWAFVDEQPLQRARSSSPPPDARPSPSPGPAPDVCFRSVSPPLAAARRLGIEPCTAVSLQPFADPGRKQGFSGMRGFKGAGME